MIRILNVFILFYGSLSGRALMSSGVFNFSWLFNGIVWNKETRFCFKKVEYKIS